VAAHVHHRVERQPAGVPAAARARLGTVYRRQAGDAVIIQEALRELFVAFARREIPVIVLKGAAMAAAVYRNVAARPMRDIDVLVQPGDLAAAEEAVGALGYQPDYWYRPRDWYVANMHHLAPFARPRGPVPVEIHHGITPPSSPVRLDARILWERAQQAAVAGQPVLVLAPDDLLLHLCLHLTTGEPFVGGLGIVRDIAEVLRRLGNAIDPERVVRTALGAGASRHLYAALEIARRVTGVQLPPPLRDLARRSAGFGALGDRALELVGHLALAPSHSRRFLLSVPVSAWGRSLVEAGGFLSRAAFIAGVVTRTFVQVKRPGSMRAEPPVTQLEAPVPASPSGPPRPVPAALRRVTGVHEYPLGDELLIYPPGGQAAHTLNPSARIVWSLCDGIRTESDICRELAADLGREPRDLAADVGAAIARFRELGLLAGD
jgi:hypothetical protein